MLFKLSKFFLILFFFSGTALLKEHKNFPRQLGSYKDPRSSKRHIACALVKREKMFADADLVFFGKFLSRKEDTEKKVYLDKYKVVHVWKGDSAKESEEVEVEVPPPSDFCTDPRSIRYEGAAVANAGGFIIYAKGKPSFLDCCMSEMDDLALRDSTEMDRLNSDFMKLKNTVR